MEGGRRQGEWEGEREKLKLGVWHNGKEICEDLEGLT